MDHAKRTIETYDQIATDYHVIATPEHRAWLEDSMREFYSRLPGKTALVAGCGEGRDSRYGLKYDTGFKDTHLSRV